MALLELNIHQRTQRRFLKGLAVFLALLAMVLHAQVVSREYQLKAVFVFRFTQFVDWPETAFPAPDSPIVIGVLGPDPFGGYLEAAVRNERVHNRRLTVQHFQRSQDAKKCQVLYIGFSDETRLETALADLKGQSILTVGDANGFVLRGGMVQFVTEQNRIRFRINLKAARAVGIQISSKLLELAEVVNAQKE